MMIVYIVYKYICTDMAQVDYYIRVRYSNLN